MIIALFISSIIYSVKIVLELNLGISITMNTIEGLHFMAILSALGMIMVSMAIKHMHEKIDFKNRDFFYDLS